MKRYFTPTNIALGLSIAVTCFWILWGVIEMFHEGWYAPFEWIFFLLPTIVILALTLTALRAPRVGALLFATVGILFGAWVLVQSRRSGASAGWSLGALLSWTPTTLLLVFIGACFFAGRRQARTRAHYAAAVGVPLLLGLLLAIEPAIRVSQRADDGNLGARLVAGNGVTLRWAPAGPGWDRDGGVAWNEIALYGKGAVGFTGKRFGATGLCNGAGDWTHECATPDDMRAYNVCLYLNRDGTTLMSTRQNLWRMPTTDELVRSLTRAGTNAGCVWDSASRCAMTPDKESPLWDPQARVIYYWTADAASAGEARFVVYNGGVWTTFKFAPLGSRGFRCVQEENE